MTVRPVHALEGETVEIRWTVPEGIFYEQVTCPPFATRDARPADLKPIAPVIERPA